MIADVEPVAHVPAVAVDRQRLAGERVVRSSAGSASRGTAAARSCSSSWWSASAGRRCDGRHAPDGPPTPSTRSTGCWARRTSSPRTPGRPARASRRPRRSRRARSEIARARRVGSAAQWARAASSSAKVPTTLVAMNSAGPWIERSTWLSAREVDDGARPVRAQQMQRPGRDRRCRRGRI